MKQLAVLFSIMIMIICTGCFPPTFEPPGDTYNEDIAVELKALGSSKIYYTLNGDDPSIESIEYSEPIPVKGNGTTVEIKAITVLGNMDSLGDLGLGDLASSIKSSTYVIDYNAVATPLFSKEEGTYEDAIDVEITCSTIGASIYYTLDGSTPTEYSEPYTDPIHISDLETTIKAIAIKSSLTDSDIGEATYEIGNGGSPAGGPDINGDGSSGGATPEDEDDSGFCFIAMAAAIMQ